MIMIAGGVEKGGTACAGKIKNRVKIGAYSFFFENVFFVNSCRDIVSKVFRDFESLCTKNSRKLLKVEKVGFILNIFYLRFLKAGTRPDNRGRLGWKGTSWAAPPIIFRSVPTLGYHVITEKFTHI